MPNLRPHSDSACAGLPNGSNEAAVPADFTPTTVEPRLQRRVESPAFTIGWNSVEYDATHGLDELLTL